MKDYSEATAAKNGYAKINGLNMYYEIEGKGSPLVYIPPVFGFAGLTGFPDLTEYHSVISMDLQGHGRTADIADRPISFEQHAADVVALLTHLNIANADFLGESFGGTVATIIAVRKPDIVRRVATYGSIFGSPQTAFKREMLATQLSLRPDAPGIQFQRENYQRVAPDPSYWPKIWLKVFSAQWAGLTENELRAIEAPLLIATGDHDFVRLEHMIETFHLVPNAELAVIPDAGHFVFSAEPHKVMPVVKEFFARSGQKISFGTTETGYHPGETR